MFEQKNSKILLCVFIRRNQDPAPRLYYYLLTAPPLFLYSFPSLISNCLNLPFGMQVRSRRLKKAYFLQTRSRGQGEALYQGGPQGVPPCLSPRISSKGGGQGLHPDLSHRTGNQPYTFRSPRTGTPFSARFGKEKGGGPRGTVEPVG